MLELALLLLGTADPRTIVIELEGSEKAADLIALAEAYAAWPGHCAEAKAAMERFEGACRGCPELADAERRFLVIARACTSEVTLSGSAPLSVDGTVLGASPARASLWPGPHIAAGGGLERAFCVDPKANLQIAIEAGDPRSIKSASDPRARAKLYEAAAIRHIEAGELCAAAARLEAVYAAVPNPEVLYNLALVVDKRKSSCTDALAAFERYLSECTRCAKKAEAQVRATAIRNTCKGQVVIATEPSGGSVEIDGQPRGLAPLGVDLVPGRHSATAKKDDRQTSVAFYLDAGEQRGLTLTLPAPTPPPPAPAAAPPAATALIAPAPEPTTLTPWAWTAIGVGAASAAAGTAFYFLARSSRDDYDALIRDASTSTEPIRPRAESLRSEIQRNAAIAYAGWSLGGAAVAAGAILLYIDAKAQVAIVPLGNGAVIAAAF